MAYANPNQVAVNSTVPFGAQGLDQATWTAGAAWKLLNGIIQQAVKYGDASQVGLPASWPYGPIQNEDILAGGKASPILEAKVQNYVNSQTAQSDQDFNSFVGANYATAAPGGYIDRPLTASEQLARDKFDFDKTQSLLKLYSGGGSSGGTVPRSATTSTRTSSSGGGSSASSLADDLALLQARTDSSRSLEQQQFDLQKELMLLQFQLDNDPNNPKLLLQQQQLAEEVRQFNASLALQEKAQGMDRAKIISDYGANPGDAVAREYFLHQGANPVGTAIDIFTGQPTGQQMTLSQVMQNNAPIVNPALNMPSTAPPSPVEPPVEPPVEGTPAFAHGTDPQLTSDGWTRADRFITGDHPMGMPNPEVNQVRVRNGQAETKVTPISQIMRGGRRMPMFASGTRTGTGTAPLTGTTGTRAPDYAPPDQALAYQPSTAVSPTYNSAGQSNLVTGNMTDPIFTQKNSGVQYNVSQAEADPYFGTAYQGMAPDAKVTNGNSAFYGMTAADAYQAELRSRLSNDPRGYDAIGQVLNNQYTPVTVVGPIGGTTTDGWLGSGASSADVAGDMSHIDPAYYSWSGNTGYQRPVNQVNTQAEAGILTGAQISNGLGQSGDPGAPWYVRPTDLPPLPGEGSAQGPTGEPGGETGVAKPFNPEVGAAQPYNPAQMTAPTTVPMQSPDASGNSLVTGQGQFIKDGATYDLRPGDYQRPDGSWVRYDPIFKEYMPILPQLTQISSEKDFWNLPPDVQQKIFTGQPTGYALVGSWVQSMGGGFTQPEGPMRRDAFNALPDAEKANLYNNPPFMSGASAPDQIAPRIQNGPQAGALSGLLRLLQSRETPAQQIDYSSYLLGKDGFPIDDAAARLMGVPTRAEDSAWAGALVEATRPTATNTAPAPAAPPTPTTPITPTAPTTPTTPATSTTPTIPTTPTTTPEATALSQLLQLLGLSYDGTTWQNNPALSFLSGNTSEGDYGNITNNPVEVPGLGVTLPSPNQAMNYSMLQTLIDSGGFDLLNSLYTAGNVPLSQIMKIAEARAPRGNAYESSLISS